VRTHTKTRQGKGKIVGYSIDKIDLEPIDISYPHQISYPSHTAHALTCYHALSKLKQIFFIGRSVKISILKTMKMLPLSPGWATAATCDKFSQLKMRRTGSQWRRKTNPPRGFVFLRHKSRRPPPLPPSDSSCEESDQTLTATRSCPGPSRSCSPRPFLSLPALPPKKVVSHKSDGWLSQLFSIYSTGTDIYLISRMVLL
jgi:hypothetical protein